jgi:hypothetical protein
MFVEINDEQRRHCFQGSFAVQGRNANPRGLILSIYCFIALSL